MRDSKAFKERFLRWKNGEQVYDGGRIKEVVITPDYEYNLYLNTLPDNLRLSPETEYRQHRYWELNNKPKSFNEAVDKGMFVLEKDGWHANSVAENMSNGEIELMKPNYHPTRYMEEMEYWRNKDFNSRYKILRGLVFDKYIPRFVYGKDGELVYDRDRIIHAIFGLDDEEPADALAVRNRQVPLEIQEQLSPVFAQRREAALKEANARNLAAVIALNLTQISSAEYVSPLLLEYYANKEDTRRFMERKQKGEELADKIFGTAFDIATLYAPAAKLAFGAAKQIGKIAVKPIKRALESVAAKESPRIIENTNKVVPDFGGFSSSDEFITSDKFKNLSEEQLLLILLQKEINPYGGEYYIVRPEYEKYVSPGNYGLYIEKNPTAGDLSYFYKYYTDDYFKETPLIPPNVKVSEFLGESPIPVTKSLQKPVISSWQEYPEYRQELENIILNDWNSNGPLRSHLERSGITDPMILFDYIATPETMWKNAFSKPGLLDFEGQRIKKEVFDSFFKSHPEELETFTNSMTKVLSKKIDTANASKIRDYVKTDVLEEYLQRVQNVLDEAEKVLRDKATLEGKFFDPTEIETVKNEIFDDFYSAANKESLKNDLYMAADKLYGDNSFASNRSGLIYIPFEQIKNGEFKKHIAEVISHEFGHLEDVPKFNPDIGVVESLQNATAPDAGSSLFKAAFDLEKTGIPKKYFSGILGDNATEMAQRATQLKDFYRLKRGEKLTMELLKKAKKIYKEDVMDNNMSEFFKSIKDYKYALLWINAHGKMLIPTIASSSALYKSKITE